MAVTLPAVVSRTQRDAVNRVFRLCNSGMDQKTLRAAIIAELRTLVDFDAYVWVLTDPHTSVGAAPLADVPCLDKLPALIRLKYLTSLNRWTSLRRDQVALLHRDTRGDLARSLVWRDLLAAYDVRDIASTVFRDKYGCWGFLDLWRVGDREPFSAAEGHLLASVIAEVTSALRRTQAATFAPLNPEPRRDAGAAVLLLSPDLDVRAQTSQTRDYLASLLPPSDDRTPIPAIAYNAAAQLLANEAGIDDHPPSTRVHLSGGQWLTLRAARIGDTRPSHARDIAVSIEETTSADRLPLFAAAFGLSPRETEVLEQLSAGRDTKDLATTLFVSEHTVHDHLKSIFSKTGIRTRAALVSAALGTPNPA